ncbi:hypothetical protein [Actinomycetospora aeridis]|uniref:DUF222 domain-containing protein n=1 Tax=Actinomycetospora aeridis TaxID=3129231 RepID=A0ABU8N3S8_9PSEU
MTKSTPREAAELSPDDLATWIVDRIEGPASSRIRAGLHDDIEAAIGYRDHARATAGGEATGPGDLAGLREDLRYVTDQIEGGEAVITLSIATRVARAALALDAHRCAGPAVEVAGEEDGSEDEKPGQWITDEFRRAQERMATVPPHARPMWTRGSFGDRGRFDAPAAPPAEGEAGRRDAYGTLVLAALAATRVIPDGELRSGCVVSDGGQVREQLRAAVRGVKVALSDATSPSPEAVTHRLAVSEAGDWVHDTACCGEPLNALRSPFLLTLTMERTTCAPVPPASLSVGDEVTSQQQLGALPVGAVVRDDVRDLCERFVLGGSCGGWRCDGAETVPALPARVLDLPGGES